MDGSLTMTIGLPRMMKILSSNLPRQANNIVNYCFCVRMGNNFTPKFSTNKRHIEDICLQLSLS